jgi:hypothetical protein
MIINKKIKLFVFQENIQLFVFHAGFESAAGLSPEMIQKNWMQSWYAKVCCITLAILFTHFT